MYPASKSTVSPSWGRRTAMRAYGPSSARASIAKSKLPPRSRRRVLRPRCRIVHSSCRHPSDEKAAISDMDPSESAIALGSACARHDYSGIVSGRMAPASKKPGRRDQPSSRRIVAVVVPPVDELDLVGPLQVFNSVNRLAGRTIYAIEVVTNAEHLTVAGESGVLTFLAREHFSHVEGPCDSVLVVCGLGSRSVRDPSLSEWLREKASEVRRLGAVCVGSFLLAEAGLLNGRRATTHWRFGRELAERFPRVRVEHDPVWVKDENIYTSAGISAGIDLALAWVEQDCGAALAHEAARELVLFLRRPGGQPQVSVSLASQASEMCKP